VASEAPLERKYSRWHSFLDKEQLRQYYMKTSFTLAPLLTLTMFAFGQSKDDIIKEYVDSFNKRDIEKFVALFDDSAKIVAFPDMIREKSKSEIEKTHLDAFKSKEMSGEITILGKTEINDIYIVEQSLRGFKSEPVDQYLIFKFRGHKILEIYCLPKNFSWKRF
jgi:hypothetical protein